MLINHFRTFHISNNSASFFLDKWNRQLQFAFYWLILGLVTIIFPFCTNYSLYLFISALQGFLIPYLNTIPSVWVSFMP